MNINALPLLLLKNKLNPTGKIIRFTKSSSLLILSISAVARSTHIRSGLLDTVHVGSSKHLSGDTNVQSI